MDNLKTIEGKVKAVLQKNEDARNDDMVLYLALCNLYLKDAGTMPLAEIMTRHKELGLPSFESVGRTRRKLQEMSFEYGGHHFIPERQFTKREDDFFKITRRLKTDRELGFFAADYYGRGSQKFPYSYDDFYAASTDKKCDIFRCVENGRLYVPCQYELQQYMDAPQKEIPQGHTSMPRERGQTKEGGTPMNGETRSNQGYEIIESCTIGNTELVIGHHPKAPNPYVCWYCKGGDNYYWGCYCNTLEAAREKLNERYQSECEMPYNQPSRKPKSHDEHER